MRVPEFHKNGWPYQAGACQPRASTSRWQVAQPIQGRQSQESSKKREPLLTVEAVLAGLLAVTPPGPGAGLSGSGSQRLKAAGSVMFCTYQTRFVASQRAPRRLASSFSAKGTCRFVLMGLLLRGVPGGGQGIVSPQPRPLQGARQYRPVIDPFRVGGDTLRRPINSLLERP